MLSLTLAVIGPRSSAAQQLQDVVYLKDGSVVRGTIVEQRPGESILIRTRDGSTFRYTVDRIDKMTREAPGATAIAQVRPRKSPAAAGWMSALITGGGQGYNGEWGKAGLFFGGAILFGSAMQSELNSDACLYDSECGNAGGYAVAWLGTAVWSIVDAVRSARRINAAAAQSDVAAFRLNPYLQVGHSPDQGRVGLRSGGGMVYGVRVTISGLR